MTANPIPALIYIILLGAALLLPYASRHFGWKVAADRDQNWLPILTVGGGVVLALLRGEFVIGGAGMLLLSVFGFGFWQISGALAALLLFSAATWWIAGVDLSSSQKILFTGICLLLALAARRIQFNAGVTVAKSSRDMAFAFGLLLLGLLAGLLSGAVSSPLSAAQAWHHWGAYLSPVESLNAGGVPFRDFPVQYGMGPTLLVAGLCGSNCWNGIYVAVVACNALYLALLGWSVLLLTRGMGLPARLLSLGSMICAVLIWTGDPADWGSPLIYPSVAGLRFLPLVALLSFILTIEMTEILPKWRLWCGHALWLVGLFWSPEAAFFSSLVWWPYLALRDAESREGWSVFLLGGLRGVLALLAGYAALAVLFRIVFDAWVAGDDFLIYIKYPPGPLPVSLLGPVWWVAVVLILAVMTSLIHSTRREGRAQYACFLATLGSLSYYLSRSHDSNIINLFPFLLLLLIATLAARQTPFVIGFVRTSLLASIAFVSAFGFHWWTAERGSSVGGVQFGGAPLIAQFSPLTPQPKSLVPRDAAVAFNDLYKLGGGQILLFDQPRVMVLSPSGGYWTGVNNSANFDPLPNAIILHYIRRGAAVYHRPGWIVIHRAQVGDSHWLPLFRVVYDVDAQRDYGTYVAFHLTPKPKQ